MQELYFGRNRNWLAFILALPLVVVAWGAILLVCSGVVYPYLGRFPASEGVPVTRVLEAGYWKAIYAVIGMLLFLTSLVVSHVFVDQTKISGKEVSLKAIWDSIRRVGSRRRGTTKDIGSTPVQTNPINQGPAQTV